MMSSLFDMTHAGATPAAYPSDVILEELSRQMAFTSRRFSRGSNGQRPGNAMRVMKPRSANNSPRSSITQQRRRTLMGESLLTSKNQQPSGSPYLPTPGMEASFETYPDPMKRAARPVSWHPSSFVTQPHPQLQIPQQAAYPFPVYNDADMFSAMSQFPPTPAAYSGYSSPASAFSPMSLPYAAYEAPQYFPAGPWGVPTGLTPDSCISADQMQPTTATFGAVASQGQNEPYQSSMEWNTYVPHGLDRVTAPPTPEDVPQPKQLEPALTSEESIPYKPLEDDEPEGEILIGMGLYDAPEKEVDLFRSTVSQLLGSPCYPEATGKGLKLEDAWEPPAMDDDDEEDESQDGEEDAEGEEQSDN